MPDSQLRFHSFRGKRRILVVEDEPINQEILTMILSDSYEVLLAATGRAALDVVRAEFDTLSIILLDLNLPDMHGLDVLRQLKADQNLARLPVIVMTADSEAEVECLTLGAIDFIPKPYPQPKVILARVLRTIELSEDRDILRWTERDQLTGLYNKEFFYRYAVQFDLYHRDVSTDAVMLDINRFHTINDRYGKHFGDEILRQLAQRTLAVFGGSDSIVCRSGADTFLIYCPHRDDYAALQDRLGELLGGNGRRVQLRVGVYPEVDKSLDVERRFDRAKMAADAVKGSLSRSVGYYDKALHEEELFHAQLMEEFSAALREGQFRVYFQPKYAVRGDRPRLCSAEALVRWMHPKHGLINPGVFIPLFENNGLIQVLDRWVWAQTAGQIRSWQERFGILLPVSVNVSRVDLYEAELVERLAALVQENRLSPQALLLEITESAYTEEAGPIVQRVKALRQLGFRIEMDDFGTGYSSLSMLSTLPIDALKLDMSFVRAAFGAQRDTRLLEVMIRLADSFGVPTIAEGVETEEQLKALRQMGCDMIQGYYFSKPVPAAEFEHFFQKRNGGN